MWQIPQICNRLWFCKHKSRRRGGKERTEKIYFRRLFWKRQRRRLKQTVESYEQPVAQCSASATHRRQVNLMMNSTETVTCRSSCQATANNGRTDGAAETAKRRMVSRCTLHLSILSNAYRSVSSSTARRRTAEY